MKLTPLPLIVWAITTVGRPEAAGTAPSTRSSAAVIVTVDLLDVPAERPPLLGEGIEVEHLGDRAKALDLVEVDDDAEIAELVMGRKQDAFPVRALVAFAVAEQAEHAAAAAPPERAASAMPIAIGRPWPSEPVETSTPGTAWLTCPVKIDPSRQ